MHILIVYTYPHKESLNGAFLASTLEGLSANQDTTSVKVLDLYEENFNPALYFDDIIRRRDLHQLEETQKYREQLLWADKIIFIYPIWWGRPPAMLLGYIDRVFVSNFAFRAKENSPIAEGLLKNKEVICISTMKGPTNYPLLILGNAHKILMRKALFNYVGIKKVRFFEFGNMESAKGKQTQKLQKIKAYMAQ